MMQTPTLLQTIGHTPLIPITHIPIPDGVTLLAKAEYLNPGGSIKDRVAYHMIDAAIERGEITDTTVLIEPTSGNTGIGLAMVCAARGIDLILTMPESMSIERRKLLEHLGARLILTPAQEGIRGSIQAAQELERTIPGGRILGQFANPDNPDAHTRTTAVEIVEALDGRAPDILIAAVGTGGTLMGIGRHLRRVDPTTRIVAVEPAASAVLSGEEGGAHGIQGIGAGFVPPIVDREMIDEVITVTDDEAITYARQAARQAGLLVGISSGANLAAAAKIAHHPQSQGRTLVTILPDGAERYLSTGLFDTA